jgi:hypothetical protein
MSIGMTQHNGLRRAGLGLLCVTAFLVSLMALSQQPAPPPDPRHPGHGGRRERLRDGHGRLLCRRGHLATRIAHRVRREQPRQLRPAAAD